MVNIDDVSGLVDCIAPLDDQGRQAVHEYWDRVIRDEWGPAVDRTPARRAMTELEERRSRRETRRAMARIARATLADRHTGPVSASTPALGGEAA